MDYSSTQSFFNLRRHRPSFPLGLPGFQSSEAGYLPSLPAQDSLEPFGSEEEESAPAFLPSNASSGPRRGSGGSDRVFFDASMDSNLGENLDRSARIDDSWYSRGKTEVWDEGEASERTAGNCHSEADCYGNTVNGFYPTGCISEEGLRQKVKANCGNYTQAVYNREANKQTAFHCRGGTGAFTESGVEYSRMDSRLTEDYSGREEDYGSSCGSGEDQVQAVEGEAPWHSASPSNQGEGRWRESLEDHHGLTTASPPQRPHSGRTYPQKLDSFSEAFLSQRKRFPMAPRGDSSEQMWELRAMRGETGEPVKSRQSCAFGSDPYLPPSSSSSSPALPGLIPFPSPPTSSHLMPSVLSPPPTPLPPPSHSPSKMDSPGCSAAPAAPLQGGEPLGALQFFMSHLQSMPSVHPPGMIWKFPLVGGKTSNSEEKPRSSDADDFCNSTATDVPQSPQSVFFTSSSHRSSPLQPTRALCSSSSPSLHASFHLPSRPPRPSGQRHQAEENAATQKVKTDLTSLNQSLPQKPAAPIFTGRPFPSVLHSSRGQKRGRYTPQPVLNPHRKGTGLFSSLSSLHHRNEAEACGGEEEEYSVSPRINVGPDHQADLPSCRWDSKWSQGQEPQWERLLWKPWDDLEESADLQDQVAKLLSMCSSSCLPGGGSNTELALHCLHNCQGNTMATLEMLLFSQPSPTGDYHYSGCDFWTDSEKTLFIAALATLGKDFSLIQKMVKTKSLYQCVEFYYLSKKLQDKQKKQKEEEERRDEEMERQRSATPKCQPVDRQFVREEVVPVPPLASFFPCKLCGKMFYKIKSRNAHMKIHRQPQEDWADRRLQHQLLTQRLALSRPTHLMPIPSADLLPPQAAALTFPSSGLLETSSGNPGDVSSSVMNGNLVLPCNTNVLSPSASVSYSSIAFPNSHLITNIDGVDSTQRESVSASPFHPPWSSFGHQTDMATLYSNPEVKEEVLAETAVDKEVISWQ